MKSNLTLSALGLAAALSIAPAIAQNAATHATTSAPATGRTGDVTATTPHDRDPVMTHMGDARASKVIGSSVYHDQDEKVGSIDDLLVGRNGKINAVLSVGGFLGMGTKYVEVPYSDLTFGNTRKDSDNKVVLKGLFRPRARLTAGGARAKDVPVSTQKTVASGAEVAIPFRLFEPGTQQRSKVRRERSGSPGASRQFSDWQEVPRSCPRWTERRTPVA